MDFPDIDVDLAKSQCGDIKTYLGKRYGEGQVCAIGTASRSVPKATLTDLAR